MKIRGKLITSYVVVALISSLGGYFAMHMVSTVNAEFRRQAEDEMPLNQDLQNLKYAGLRIVSSTVEYAFVRQQAADRRVLPELEEEKALVAKGREAFFAALKRYEEELRSHDVVAHELASVARFRAAGDELLRTSTAIINGVDRKIPAAELLELKEKNESAEQHFLEIVGRQFRENDADFTRNRMLTYKTMQWALRNIFIISASTLALALASGIFMSRSIVRRLKSLQDAAKEIGDGNLHAEIDTSAKDEIGSLAKGFRQMADDLDRTTREIRAGKDFLDEIINSMMDALVVVSPDGKVQSVNCEACSMLRYDEEPVGKSFAEIMPDSALDELVAKGYMRDEERTFVAGDGTQIPVAFSGSVLWNPDNSMRGIVCVAQDITRRKEAEADLQRFTEELLASNEELKNTEERLQRYAQNLQETNEELKGFAYIISHDLRSPLVNIKGFTGELKESLEELKAICTRWSGQLDGYDGKRLEHILDQDVPEAFNFINMSVSRMDSLISMVLKLSRLGHRELTREAVDLNEMVGEILKNLAHQLEQRQAEVKVGPLPTVFQDRVALEQILGNLLDNAVKYLDESRSGRLEVWVESKPDTYIFHFRDNGRGISAEDLGKIFEIFRRGGIQDVQGDGMGLAYVKAQVRRLGGHIWCESVLGVGSTFSFSLPFDGYELNVA